MKNKSKLKRMRKSVESVRLIRNYGIIAEKERRMKKPNRSFECVESSYAANTPPLLLDASCTHTHTYGKNSQKRNKFQRFKRSEGTYLPEKDGELFELEANQKEKERSSFRIWV